MSLTLQWKLAAGWGHGWAPIGVKFGADAQADAATRWQDGVGVRISEPATESFAVES
jgi:hypothetical protein